MKLFDFFGRKKKKVSDIDLVTEGEEVTQEAEIDTVLEPEENDKIVINNTQYNINYVKESCEQITDAKRQIQEAKIEYEAVTSYLSDMQKIDQLPTEERESLDEAAKKIIALTKERMKYQRENNIRITDKQFKYIEKYEDDIPEEIKKIQGYESYNSLIKSDLRHLEGEKGALLYEKEEIIHQQTYLKKLAMITSGLVFSLFLLFMLIALVTDSDMMIPFLLTVVMAAVSSAYIFYESRKNRYDVKVVESKLSRAVSLMNKVKIKYVNNTSCMDYAYNKYSVKSAMELSYLWEQYMRAKDQEKKYKKNTELLNFYNEVIVNELKQFRINDPDIWIFQAAALVDNKEMVEIRHRLNVRRQKLRDRIDYNSEIEDREIGRIKKYMEQKPGDKREVESMLLNYRVEL